MDYLVISGRGAPSGSSQCGSCDRLQNKRQPESSGLEGGASGRRLRKGGAICQRLLFIAVRR
jgi:hypothetical protein